MFNAETFIIGLCSGIMGIVLSEILLIPGNIIIQKVSGTSTLVAALPVDAALFLVALATLLTILAGIIPARGAAKSNPVKAPSKSPQIPFPVSFPLRRHGYRDFLPVFPLCTSVSLYPSHMRTYFLVLKVTKRYGRAGNFR